MKQKKMTPGVFAFAAQNYIQRYFASTVMLRRALERRAFRFVRKHGGTIEEAKPLIEAEIKKRIEDGSLNDALFAETMVRELQKSGASLLKIKQKLFQKGLSSIHIDNAIRSQQDLYDPRDSALRYAKKRGFGPYRAPHIQEDRFKKELASMVRAGHSYGISKEILVLTREEAEEEEE
jgi:regulatory protein